MEELREHLISWHEMVIANGDSELLLEDKFQQFRLSVSYRLQNILSFSKAIRSANKSELQYLVKIIDHVW